MASDDVLRNATPEDAKIIGWHRAWMFEAMGMLRQEETEAFIDATVPWLQQLLISGEYKGFLLEQEGLVVAGGGLHLSRIGPVPGCMRVGTRGHLANIYTLPAHRRRGLAGRLLEVMVRWSECNGVDQLTLDASADGRRLYESLGFTGTSMMRKVLTS